MAQEPKKNDINHLIWNRVMNLFTEKATDKAGSDLHCKSLINLNMFIDRLEGNRRVIH